MKILFDNEEDKDQFLRLATAATIDDLIQFGAIFEVEGYDQHLGLYQLDGFDDYDDLDGFDYDLFDEIPF